MRDGSALTLRRSVELHGGESAASRDAFDELTAEEQAYLLRFLASL
ncbi:di-heme oxidoredictase family protein [Gemmatimonadota bacterium]